MLPSRLPSGAPLRVLCGLFLAAFLAPVLGAQTGTVSGTVSNIATGNNLEGARVEIARLGLVALSDNSGRYVLAGVPAGDHEVLATYIGLDPVRVAVSVGAGASVARNFEMTTGIYKLEAFKVTGEREGNAAMITEKKNASNVKDIISMDS
ncbi:MAG: carboxypeptidase-like regulatory domain-containing protein, partial [Verrucomicrobiota bacterium]